MAHNEWILFSSSERCVREARSCEQARDGRVCCGRMCARSVSAETAVDGVSTRLFHAGPLYLGCFRVCPQHSRRSSAVLYLVSLSASTVPCRAVCR
ncbi:unnamed protein product, partial [Brenthis ino]